MTIAWISAMRTRSVKSWRSFGLKSFFTSPHNHSCGGRTENRSIIGLPMLWAQRMCSRRVVTSIVLGLSLQLPPTKFIRTRNGRAAIVRPIAWVGTILIALPKQPVNFNDEDAPLLASARAGNVIGGGDWSEDRLVPDFVRSVTESNSLLIRSPHATRPWQHVLECLSGYLLLGQRLLEKRQEFAAAWNFGPPPEANRTVTEILTSLQLHWPDLKWEQTNSPQPHEATLLYLDHTKANEVLDWRPIWDLDQALRLTADWYRQFHEHGATSTAAQLDTYIADAQSKGVCWVNE